MNAEIFVSPPSSRQIDVTEQYTPNTIEENNPELVKAVEELLNDKGTTTEANQPVQQDTPTGKELAADTLDRIASKLGGKIS